MAKKKSVEHIKNKMDYYIGNYVYDKKEVKKAKKYAAGIRDHNDYAFLEDNYGIGTPSVLKFSPLISLRMNILKGILISSKIQSQVIAIDRDTVEKESQEFQDQEDKKANEVVNEVLLSDDVAEAYARVMDKYDAEFVSSFQSAAQHIVDNFINSHDFNIMDKMEAIFDELLTSGEFVVKDSVLHKNVAPDIEVCPSENVFFVKNKNSTNINSSDAIVYKRYMTKRQVIVELGGFMTEADRKEFLEDKDIGVGMNNSNVIREYGISRFSINNNYLTDDLFDSYYKNLNEVVEVFHVQYKDVERVTKEPFTFDERLMTLLKKRKKVKEDIEVLYEGYKVGNKHYLGIGKKKDPKRDYKDFRKVLFDYSGLSLNSFRSKPKSIVFDMIDLQDMVDMMIFHRDNTIQLSGVRGSRVNLAAIPKSFGKNLMDRIKTFKAMKKNGDEFLDFTQEGAALFQQAGDYNNSLDGNAIMAINGVIELVGQEADSVCGINANMRGQIQQRDAVSNVATGIKMISYATKKYYTYADRGMEMILLSLLNGVKKSYPDGYSGVYYVGKNREAFSIAPSQYTLSTFVLNVRREDVDTIDKEKLGAVENELVKGGLLKPEHAILAMTTKSKQELETLALDGLKSTEQENGKIKNLTQKLDQVGKQAEDLAKQNEKYAQEIENYKKRLLGIEEKKLELEAQKNKWDHEIKRGQAVSKEEIEKTKLLEVKKRTDLEEQQMYMEEGNAKEIRNL